MSILTVTDPCQGEELNLLSDIDTTPYGSTTASEHVSSNPLSSDDYEPDGPDVPFKTDNEDDGENIYVHEQHNGRGTCIQNCCMYIRQFMIHAVNCIFLLPL